MSKTIPFERHEQIGELLFGMRNRLLTLYIEVANARGGAKRRRRAAAALNTAYHKIDLARSELEETMFFDHPAQAQINVYYRSNRKPPPAPSAKSVFTCDVCRQPIDRTHAGLAMIYWQADTHHDNRVSEFAIGHKSCVPQGSTIDRWGLSAEIGWFVEPEAALYQLARLTTTYVWEGAELRRLCLVMWAAPIMMFDPVPKKKERKK